MNNNEIIINNYNNNSFNNISDINNNNINNNNNKKRERVDEEIELEQQVVNENNSNNNEINNNELIKNTFKRIKTNEFQKSNIQQLKLIASTLGIPQCERKDELYRRIETYITNQNEFIKEIENKQDMNPFNKELKLQITDGLELKELLFWRVFRNKSIFFKIFSNFTFNKLSSYKELHSIQLIFRNYSNAVEIIVDKLKSNSIIIKNPIYDSSVIFSYVREKTQVNKSLYNLFFTHLFNTQLPDSIFNHTQKLEFIDKILTMILKSSNIFALKSLLQHYTIDIFLIKKSLSQSLFSGVNFCSLSLFSSFKIINYLNNFILNNKSNSSSSSSSSSLPLLSSVLSSPLEETQNDKQPQQLPRIQTRNRGTLNRDSNSSNNDDSNNDDSNSSINKNIDDFDISKCSFNIQNINLFEDSIKLKHLVKFYKFIQLLIINNNNNNNNNNINNNRDIKINELINQIDKCINSLTENQLNIFIMEYLNYNESDTENLKNTLHQLYKTIYLIIFKINNISYNKKINRSSSYNKHNRRNNNDNSNNNNNQNTKSNEYYFYFKKDKLELNSININNSNSNHGNKTKNNSNINSNSNEEGEEENIRNVMADLIICNRKNFFKYLVLPKQEKKEFISKWINGYLNDQVDRYDTIDFIHSIFSSDDLELIQYFNQEATPQFWYGLEKNEIIFNSIISKKVLDYYFEVCKNELFSNLNTNWLFLSSIEMLQHFEELMMSVSRKMSVNYFFQNHTIWSKNRKCLEFITRAIKNPKLYVFKGNDDLLVKKYIKNQNDDESNISSTHYSAITQEYPLISKYSYLIQRSIESNLQDDVIELLKTQRFRIIHLSHFFPSSSIRYDNSSIHKVIYFLFQYIPIDSILKKLANKKFSSLFYYPLTLPIIVQDNINYNNISENNNQNLELSASTSTTTIDKVEEPTIFFKIKLDEIISSLFLCGRYNDVWKISQVYPDIKIIEALYTSYIFSHIHIMESFFSHFLDNIDGSRDVKLELLCYGVFRIAAKLNMIDFFKQVISNQPFLLKKKTHKSNKSIFSLKELSTIIEYTAICGHIKLYELLINFINLSKNQVERLKKILHSNLNSRKLFKSN